MKIKPHIDVLAHQAQFANNDDKFCAIVGGFGSGKSQADVYRSIRLLEQREKAIILLIAPTYGLLADVNIPDFQEIFSHYFISYDHKKSERKFVVDSGNFQGEIWFRSADRPERMIGFDATDTIIDEFDVLKPEKQKELWRKVLGRMRGDANTTLTVSTTPEGFRETYELFEKKRIGSLIRAKTTDNHFLPPDYIQTLYDQYDEVLVKQYINAEFVNINGIAAYYAFSRDKNHKHMVEADRKQYPYIGVGMDFNVNKMCAELFVHDEHRKRIHYFDEVVLKNNADTAKMCRVLRQRYPRIDLRVYPDATGKKRSTNATESDIAILRKNGFRVYAKESNPFVRDRLSAANKMLDEIAVTIDTERCPDLVEDLEKVERDKYGEIDKSDTQLTHSSDAFSYPLVYLYPVRRPKVGTIARAV